MKRDIFLLFIKRFINLKYSSSNDAINILKEKRTNFFLIFYLLHQNFKRRNEYFISIINAYSTYCINMLYFKIILIWKFVSLKILFVYC